MGWQPPTEAEFNTWTRADGWLRVTHLSNEYTSKKWLLDRLKGGLAVGVARTARLADAPLTSFVIVPRSEWERYDDTGEDHFWETGDAEFPHFSGGYSGTTEYARYYDIRFSPDSFDDNNRPVHDELRPIVTEPALQVQPLAARLGAPRKGWWDELWIEVLRRVVDGRLNAGTASSGSKLEYDLLDIAKELGFSPGDSTLKPMALKLFKYMNESERK